MRLRIRTLKHYARLLEGDALYHDRARAWDAKIRDVHEWLAEIGISLPGGPALEQAVTYHEACHLVHGQRITIQPRRVLQAIPGLRLVELPESTLVLRQRGHLQPDPAGNGRRTPEPQTRAHPGHRGANRGDGQPRLHPATRQWCARQQGLELRVAHPITLLAEAYGRE